MNIPCPACIKDGQVPLGMEMNMRGEYSCSCCGRLYKIEWLEHIGTAAEPWGGYTFRVRIIGLEGEFLRKAVEE